MWFVSTVAMTIDPVEIPDRETATVVPPFWNPVVCWSSAGVAIAIAPNRAPRYAAIGESASVTEPDDKMKLSPEITERDEDSADEPRKVPDEDASQNET